MGERERTGARNEEKWHVDGETMMMLMVVEVVEVVVVVVYVCGAYRRFIHLELLVVCFFFF